MLLRDNSRLPYALLLVSQLVGNDAELSSQLELL
jgi:hypothetical protein